MEQQSVIHNTFVIERSYPKRPEVVFAAFADPAKKQRWFAGGETQDVLSFEIDFRVGGTELARFRLKEGTPLPGVVFTNEGRYQDIIPNKRIVTASTMSLGDRCISASLATFELVPAEKGTDLIFTHQAAFFEGSDGPQMREGGWRKLLDRLGTELAR
ncbi:MAG TPA: SRPBCC family protein [Blastocatellia bacterium]